ncbi:MAG: tetratricopeptide repeat protein [Treponema sp.]|nr:tetratricopeptide repeat protein [Treponema sp.]
MSEKIEKETASSKLNDFLEKNRKLIIGLFIALVAAVIVVICVSVVGTKTKEKNLAAIDALTYELVNNSVSLEDSELDARRNEIIEKLLPYTKKGGVSGVRANMLAAELSYQKKDYASAVDYWTTVAAKDKKAYTAPLANYNKGVCLEQLNKNEEAADAYKLASQSEDFIFKTHAMFSYGRVLESLGKYDDAVKTYTELNDTDPDDNWAKLAKTRIIDLTVQGKLKAE